MTAPQLALLAVVVACALDAATTVALLRRGGREVVSAWAIGARPSALQVWGWVFAFPVLAVAAVLHVAADTWLLAHLVAAVRLGFAVRNHRLRR